MAESRANGIHTSPAMSGAEIDLGNPVTGKPSGPPSGGSRIGWAALIHAKQVKGDSTQVEFDPIPLGNVAWQELPGAWKERWPLATRAGWQGLAAGLMLGVTICVAVWTLGVEPPQSWRQRVDTLLGRSPTTPSAPLSSQPGQELP